MLLLKQLPLVAAEGSNATNIATNSMQMLLLYNTVTVGFTDALAEATTARRYK